jgi:hypothetical protein
VVELERVDREGTACASATARWAKARGGDGLPSGPKELGMRRLQFDNRLHIGSPPCIHREPENN